jgi:neutral trehalase
MDPSIKSSALSIDRPPAAITSFFSARHPGELEITPPLRTFRLRTASGLIKKTVRRNNNQTMKPNQNNHCVKLRSQDQVNFTSADGLVQIVTKIDNARRFPRHNYPVVCIRFRQAPGSRIKALRDDDCWEVLLTHKEVPAHLHALNAADGKAAYSWTEIAEKSAARKAWWEKVNARRFERK